MSPVVNSLLMVAALVAMGAGLPGVETARLDSGLALTIRTTGLKSSQGAVAFALFDSEQSYTERSQPLRRAFVPVRDGNCEWVVEGLPPGDYAAMAYHDQNGNGQLDKRKAFGIPKEPYGFSNNVDAMFGPPTYDKARFSVTDRETLIEIRLR